LSVLSPAFGWVKQKGANLVNRIKKNNSSVVPEGINLRKLERQSTVFWGKVGNSFKIATKNPKKAVIKRSAGGWYFNKDALALTGTLTSLTAVNTLPLNEDLKTVLNNLTIIAGAIGMHWKFRKNPSAGGGVAKIFEGRWKENRALHMGVLGGVPIVAGSILDNDTLKIMGYAGVALSMAGFKNMWKNRKQTLFTVKSSNQFFQKNPIIRTLNNKWGYWGTTAGTVFFGDDILDKVVSDKDLSSKIHTSLSAALVGFGIVGPGFKEGMRGLKEKAYLAKNLKLKELSYQFANTALPMIPTLGIGMMGYYDIQRWSFESKSKFGNIVRYLLGYEDFIEQYAHA
jgi:hypothetical protein